MPIFKDKAKKLMAEMRHARNRGTCKVVGPTTEDDENFIAHVQQVMGIDPDLVQEKQSASKNPNSNVRTPDFASLVQQVMIDKKVGRDRDKSLTNSFNQMSLNTRTERCRQPEAPYNLPPEVAVSDFNYKWRAGSGESPGYSNEKRIEKADPARTVNDFHLLKTIGKGAFGKVLLVQCRRSGQFYAMKVLDKKSIVSNDNVKGVVNEKRVLECVSFPFLVQLHYHFKDAANLYMIMEFVGGGDLFFHLKRKFVFSEKEAQFYGGQIALALEYLHLLNVIYRDLKPENILINSDGYIKLTDFGLAKRLSTLGRTGSMVGTAEYLAPEVFLQKSYGKAVDWWALGILLYEMVHGKSPFRSESDAVTFEKILSGKVKFGHTTNSFKHLVMNLLKDDSTTRLGTTSANDVKVHPWFETISWTMLLEKRIEPPFIPRLHHRGDTRFFDNYSDNLREIQYMGNQDQEQDIYKDAFQEF